MSGKYAGYQTNLIDEIIVDNFAGGGGASTGIELATGRPVTIAINHDPDAILMHKTNHPFTEHYQASVWDIDPKEVCRGRPVGLAWFSPDCKHFSKAKGGKPKDKNIRGLAWIALRWAGTVRPRVIMLENVEEFQDWGPLNRKHYPIKSKQGKTFNKFIQQFKDLGYKVEYKELKACDYGAPTIRKRFFLIARCDGQPIVWPQPTHGPSNSPEVKSGKLKPYRSAAECINFDLPCPSIFERKKELAKNTKRRIARGLDKFVIKEQKSYLVHIGNGERKGQLPRIYDIDKPLNTIVSSCKQYLCTPYLSSIKFNNPPISINKPLHTLTAVNSHTLIAPSLIQYHSETAKGEVRGQKVSEPILTVDGSNRYGLMLPYLSKFFGGVTGVDIGKPLPTVTAIDHNALTAPFLTQYYGGADHANTVQKPLQTVTVQPRHFLCKNYLTVLRNNMDSQSIDEPLKTITAHASHFANTRVYIKKYSHGCDLKYWPKIRAMLNEYTEWDIADDEVLILNINGVEHFISDIGLRMLQPDELYKAQGFPEDYKIDVDYKGNIYGKSKQVARCGNAVPPPFATALIRANLPEYCKGISINTMNELNERIAL